MEYSFLVIRCSLYVPLSLLAVVVSSISVVFTLLVVAISILCCNEICFCAISSVSVQFTPLVVAVIEVFSVGIEMFSFWFVPGGG